eukprot:scaffold185087_cov54-Prasinocladus_malaysianus.AAC.1
MCITAYIPRPSILCLLRIYSVYYRLDTKLRPNTRLGFYPQYVRCVDLAQAGWLSPFLLAAWDPTNEEFQSVCRVMSGFTDQCDLPSPISNSLKPCSSVSFSLLNLSLAHKINRHVGKCFGNQMMELLLLPVGKSTVW